MAIYCCGIEPGLKKKYSCRCCGIETDDIEQTTPGGFCWDCTIGGNFDCHNCVSDGVPFNKFSDGMNAKLHRFSHWTQGSKSVAVSVCGVEIPYEDIGQGIAVLKDCQDCWKR